MWKGIGRFAAVSLLPLLAACGSGGFEPEPVPLDRVNCARCGMMVSSAAESAEWIGAEEETRFYDDIGCLALDEPPSSARSARFVHVNATRWAPAENAFYARPAGTSTPMGYGIVAYSTREEATASDRAGRGRTWSELVSELKAEAARP